jgi:hypothetical protein
MIVALIMICFVQVHAVTVPVAYTVGIVAIIAPPFVEHKDK